MDAFARATRVGVLLGAIVYLGLSAPEALATLTVTAPDGTTRTVDANLDIQPNAAGDPFFQQVQDCLNELKALGKGGLATTLVASARAHDIRKEPDAGKGSAVSAGAGASRDAATGAPGAGAGSTTTWQPTNTPAAFPGGTYADGTPRDPCAALLHELVHAVDADQGLWSNDRMNTNTGVPPDTVLVDEVRACQAQNWMHQAKGIASRTQYGGQDLPKGVTFDKCPDDVTIDVVGGGTHFPEIVWEVPVTGTPAGKQESPVPGMPLDVGDADVTLVKNLDGTVVVKVRCTGINAVTVNSVQWTYKGQDVGPPTNLGPLVCDPTTPDVMSPPFAVPAVPALRVTKSPDEAVVAAGGSVTFTIKVENTGTVPVNNVMVTDVPFAGGSFSIPALAPGAMQSHVFTVNVGPTPGRFRNVAQAVGQAPGPLNVGPVRDFADYTVQ
jgi:uncharacterized repeat protein (TIGR01451 family)